VDGSTDDSTEENELYMRFRIGLKDISAFLVDGDFDWRKQYNVNSATGRLHAVNDNLRRQLKGSGNQEDRSDHKSGDFEGKEGGASDNVQEMDNSSNVSQTKGKGKKDVDPGDGDLFFLPMLEKTGMTIALEQVSPHICIVDMNAV
jgi:vacuolar protein sorting-associated protein 13A/C